MKRPSPPQPSPRASMKSALPSMYPFTQELLSAGSWETAVHGRQKYPPSWGVHSSARGNLRLKHGKAALCKSAHYKRLVAALYAFQWRTWSFILGAGHFLWHSKWKDVQRDLETEFALPSLQQGLYLARHSAFLPLPKILSFISDQLMGQGWGETQGCILSKNTIIDATEWLVKRGIFKHFVFVSRS